MKKIQKLSIALMVLFSASLFAQKSTFWNGTYHMEYGNQKMKIVTEGGDSYKAYFTGDCNAHTVTGHADGSTLIFPIVGGSDRDMIMVSRRGDKVDVSVKGTDIMRNACGGSSIEGEYSESYGNHNSRYNENYHRHKNYNSENFNNSYYTRDSYKYGSKVDVYDLMKIPALEAYDKLENRDFYLVKTHQSNGKTYKVWYNNETNQCIKTISIDRRIHDVLKSTHCN